jgi:class 3 adenylate cyclase/pimeloyl-ACP methyl ester carboxylesterase
VEIQTTFGYARADDGAYIGYRVDGDGPIDIAYQIDWPGNVDHTWVEPTNEVWLRQLASFARVITHDHRGVGVSSRDVALPTLETRVSDLMAVLAATGTRRPVLVGSFSTGAVHVLLAAMRPTFPRALIWVEPVARSSQAPDYPWGISPEDREIDDAFIGLWGTDAYTKVHREDQSTHENPGPDEAIQLETVRARNACTPDVAARLSDIWYETDVRGVLGAVKTPTLLLVHEERRETIEEAEFIASSMPDARVHLMPGLVWAKEKMPLWAEEVREFVGIPRPTPAPTTMLATVMFTDIVGSTERQVTLGDRAWGELISRHHALIRQTLERYGGNEIDTAGDGFYATFDGSARAVQCALDISSLVRELGIEVRIGVHTGECELIDNKVGGIAVAIGSRIAAHAKPSDVLVSQTVKALVAGSGLIFEDVGEYELKGVADRWHLYRAQP